MRLAQRLFALVVIGAAASGFAGFARADDPMTISAGGYSLTISGSTVSAQLPGSGIPIVVGSSPAPAPAPSSSPSPAPAPASAPAPAPAPAVASNPLPASTSAVSAPSTTSPASTPVTSGPPIPLPTPTPSAAPPPSNPPAASSAPAHAAKPKPTSRPRTDKKDPVVSAFAGTGTLLHSLRLRFQVSDNSGKAALALSLYKGNHTILWRTTALKLVSARHAYSLSWKPRLLGNYLFCVGAADAAGNRRSDCAKVTIHR